MFEGISKYIWGLFIIYLISYVVKKIEMAKIFKKANVKKIYAYIPFKCTKELIKISHANHKLFPLTFIPFVHISAHINIYKEMLKTYGQNPNDAIYYYFMPMVYFTKLGSGHARVEIHDYDLNNEYLEMQSMLYEPVIGEEEAPLYDMTDPGYYIPAEKKERSVYKVPRNNPVVTEAHFSVGQVMDEVKSEPIKEISEPSPVVEATEYVSPVTPVVTPVVSTVTQVEEPQVEPVVTSVAQGIPSEPEVVENVVTPVQQVVPEGPKTVFTDTSLQPDERQEKVVEAVKKEEVMVNPIKENITGRPQMCPKCGAKLAPGAKACFLCGTKL